MYRTPTKNPKICSSGVYWLDVDFLGIIRSCFSPRDMKVIITRVHSWILGNGLKILSHDATSNGADMQNVRGSSVEGHKTKYYRGFEERYSVLGCEIT